MNAAKLAVRGRCDAVGTLRSIDMRMKLLLVWIAVAALVGCASTSKTEPGMHPIVGAWELDSAQAREVGARMDMEFRPDGVRRGVMQEARGLPVVQSEDRYLIRGSDVYIVTDRGEMKLDYTIRDGRLHITSRETGDLVFKRK
jgi:hypothetical protein